MANRSTVAELQAEGNRLVKVGESEAAAGVYASALAMLERGEGASDDSSFASTTVSLLCNRSFALLKAGRGEDAERDAARAGPARRRRRRVGAPSVR